MRGTWWLAGIFGVFGLFPADADARKPPVRPLLMWEVTKDGAVSHLVGTCHAPMPLNHIIPDAQVAGLDVARVLITEVDLDALGPQAAMGLLLDPSGARLRDRLGPDDFRAFAVAMDGTPPALLDRMSPAGASMLFAMAGLIGPAASGHVPPDLAISARFPGQPAQRVYLETVDEQLALLSATGESGLAAIRASSPADGGAERSAAATRALCEGLDTAPMEAILADEAGSGPLSSMLYARNQRWMTPLEAELTRGDAWVAVGAGHMLGDQGLVRLLESRGFTITRLRGRPAPWDAPEGSFVARVPPAPPVDAATLDAWRVDLEARLSAVYCQPTVPGAACYRTLPGGCEAVVRADVRACVDQATARWPTSGVPDEALTGEVVRCAANGLPFEVLARPAPAAEHACAPLYTTMSSLMGAPPVR